MQIFYIKAQCVLSIPYKKGGGGASGPMESFYMSKQQNLHHDTNLRDWERQKLMSKKVPSSVPIHGNAVLSISNYIFGSHIV
jgi:hypothetical protein